MSSNARGSRAFNVALNNDADIANDEGQNSGNEDSVGVDDDSQTARETMSLSSQTAFTELGHSYTVCITLSKIKYSLMALIGIIK